MNQLMHEDETVEDLQLGGCALFQLGVVLVEKRECTMAIADS